MTDEKQSAIPRHESNPFATRFIRPGSLKYVFSSGESIATLIDRLKRHHWRGEIVGPHGSGKSTLVRSLIPNLTAHGIHVTLFTLRQGVRTLPNTNSDDVEWFPPQAIDSPVRPSITKLWIVDGGEQLSGFSRWRLRATTRWQDVGLLMTTHRPLGLPTIAHTETTPSLAWRLVQSLLPAGQDILSQADVETTFHRHRGNLRETFLELFDVHQQRTKRGVDPMPRG